MVRVNIIEPAMLTDQHLIAEYLEIMMLVGYVREHPSLENIPEKYTLGKGHIRFFKDKLFYLKKRHETLKEEMRKRGFSARIDLDISFPAEYLKDWKPEIRDYKIIRKRISEKIRKKPGFYTYYRKHLPLYRLLKLLDGNHSNPL